MAKGERLDSHRVKRGNTLRGRREKIEKERRGGSESGRRGSKVAKKQRELPKLIRDQTKDREKR